MLRSIPRSLRIPDGAPVWNQDQYGFLEGKAPATVNPSLWRQGQLNAINGLFEVTDGIYQIRGFDLSNMTLVRGDTGWIVIDPLVSEETARAGLELANRELGALPVVAVIYSHSHADHFGGVRGIVDPDRFAAGQVEIIAPSGFMEYAVAENVMAGNVMTRRAAYQFGNVLEKGPKGQVGSGLGQTTSTGTVTLIPPTDIVSETGTEMVVDGVPIIFQMANGSEAPSEFIFYFPEQKALCLSEVATHVMHNVYTLRGAKMRDALGWSKYINETIQLFGDDVKVAFAGHHWPTWGQERVVDLLDGQRDIYRFIHDQTLRLANQGYGPRDIANMIELPEALAQNFATRGYYGSLKHNAEAVYNYYLGWFDGNPANLDRLPPAESGARYVEFIGGPDVLLAKAQASFDKGDYRWVAEVVNHLLLADPENEAARELQAKALTQLGYQAESGPWRNFYLSGAQELRDGVMPTPAPRIGADVMTAMTPEMIFDFLALHLNPAKAGDQTLTFNFEFTDVDEQYAVSLENDVLNNTEGLVAEDADASFQLTLPAFGALLLQRATVPQLVKNGTLTFDGNLQALGQLMSMMDTFDPWFPITTQVK
nr:alkyl sulfatase dimerization domain-containing protein [Marinicella sp. W31]MDC2876998.1 alkyl sulfatase dimerization domain-containing protein [Marinicella sp. W31]